MRAAGPIRPRAGYGSPDAAGRRAPAAALPLSTISPVTSTQHALRDAAREGHLVGDDQHRLAAGGEIGDDRQHLADAAADRAPTSARRAAAPRAAWPGRARSPRAAAGRPRACADRRRRGSRARPVRASARRARAPRRRRDRARGAALPSRCRSPSGAGRGEISGTPCRRACAPRATPRRRVRSLIPGRSRCPAISTSPSLNGVR